MDAPHPSFPSLPSAFSASSWSSSSSSCRPLASPPSFLRKKATETVTCVPKEEPPSGPLLSLLPSFARKQQKSRVCAEERTLLRPSPLPLLLPPSARKEIEMSRAGRKDPSLPLDFLFKMGEESKTAHRESVCVNRSLPSLHTHTTYQREGGNSRAGHRVEANPVRQRTALNER